MIGEKGDLMSAVKAALGPAESALHEAATALFTAAQEYDEASKAESIARSRATSARNRVNETQKAFDALVEKMKKNAPRDSDWASRSRAEPGL